MKTMALVVASPGVVPAGMELVGAVASEYFHRETAQTVPDQVRFEAHYPQFHTQGACLIPQAVAAAAVAVGEVAGLVFAEPQHTQVVVQLD